MPICPSPPAFCSAHAGALPSSEPHGQEGAAHTGGPAWCFQLGWQVCRARPHASSPGSRSQFQVLDSFDTTQRQGEYRTMVSLASSDSSAHLEGGVDHAVTPGDVLLVIGAAIPEASKPAAAPARTDKHKYQILLRHSKRHLAAVPDEQKRQELLPVSCPLPGSVCVQLGLPNARASERSNGKFAPEAPSLTCRWLG